MSDTKEIAKKIQRNMEKYGVPGYTENRTPKIAINLSKPLMGVGALGVGAYAYEGIQAVRGTLDDMKKRKEKKKKEKMKKQYSQKNKNYTLSPREVRKGKN